MRLGGRATFAAFEIRHLDLPVQRVDYHYLRHLFKPVLVTWSESPSPAQRSHLGAVLGNIPESSQEMCDKSLDPIGRKRGRFWLLVFAGKAILLLAALGGLAWEFNAGQFSSAYARWPPGKPPSLSSQFATWDSAHYLLLSQNGYEAGSSSCAFYPLWPMFLRATSVATGGAWPVPVAMLLANALSLLGLGLLYRLMERHCGPAISRDALILMLAFPGALFFSFPYTESLYLVLLMWFFWGLELERWWWTALAGFLLPLARPVGVFVLLPLAWYFWERGWPQCGAIRVALGRIATAGTTFAKSALRRWRKHDSPGDGSVSGGPVSRVTPRFAPWLLLSAPVLGYALYFGLMYVWTGNAFEGFEAQKAYPNSPSIKNMFNVTGFTHALLNVGSVDGMMDGALDRGFFLLFLALLPAIYWLDKLWFFYVLPAGLVPAMTSWFMSYRRYTIVLFPLFIVLALLLARTKSRWLFWYYVILMAALQAWAVKQFINFNWAG